MDQCSQHERKLEIFCTNCQKLICLKCMKIHIGHNMLEYEDYYANLKPKAQNLIEDIKSQVETLNKEQEIESKYFGQVKAVFEEQKQKIRDQFEDLRLSLYNKELKLQKDLQNYIDSNIRYHLQTISETDHKIKHLKDSIQNLTIKSNESIDKINFINVFTDLSKALSNENNNNSIDSNGNSNNNNTNNSNNGSSSAIGGVAIKEEPIDDTSVTNILYFRNLKSTMKLEESGVRDALKQFGTILGIEMFGHYGFIEFEKAESAQRLLHHISGNYGKISVYGCILYIEERKGGAPIRASKRLKGSHTVSSSSNNILVTINNSLSLRSSSSINTNGSNSSSTTDNNTNNNSNNNNNNNHKYQMGKLEDFKIKGVHDSIAYVQLTGFEC